MLSVIQRGKGERRPLLLAYSIGAPAAALLAVLGPGPCVVSDLDDAGGRFAKAVGAGGVDALDEVIAKAAEGDSFEPSAIVLLGWSAGCQAVREQLRASGTRIDAVIALDGISGALPPTEAQMAPWLDLARRAANGGALFVATHTQQTYMEQLPPAERFASTIRTAALLCAAADIAPPGLGTEATTGGLTLISSPSRAVDGMSHIMQLQAAGPLAVKQKLVPWLIARGEPAPPETAASPSRKPAVAARRRA